MITIKTNKEKQTINKLIANNRIIDINYNFQKIPTWGWVGVVGLTKIFLAYLLSVL